MRKVDAVVKMISGGRPQASPRIDEQAKADIFVTPIASSYIQGAIGSVDALNKAEQKLIEQMRTFNYENQI